MKGVSPKNIVRTAYEDPKVVARYNEKGIWKSEEILLRRFFPKEGDVLDLGCGAGRTSVCLAQMGYRVTGIDLSPEMVRVAEMEADRLGLKIDFRAMDARELNFPDQSFDAALFSFNGLDHVSGYGAKLEIFLQVFRVLKPGAPFIFSAHRIWSPVHLPKLIAGGLKLSLGKLLGFKTMEKEWGEIYDLRATDLEERYSHFLSSGRWKKALGAAGFHIDSCESVFQLESHRPRRLLRSLRSGNLIYYVSSNFMFYVARKPE